MFHETGGKMSIQYFRVENNAGEISADMVGAALRQFFVNVSGDFPWVRVVETDSEGKAEALLASNATVYSDYGVTIEPV